MSIFRPLIEVITKTIYPFFKYKWDYYLRLCDLQFCTIENLHNNFIANILIKLHVSNIFKTVASTFASIKITPITASFAGSTNAFTCTSRDLVFAAKSLGLVKVTYPEWSDKSMQRCRLIGPHKISALCCRWYSSVMAGFSLFDSLFMLKSILSSTEVKGDLCPMPLMVCFRRVTCIVGNSGHGECRLKRTSTYPTVPESVLGSDNSNTCSSPVVLKLIQSN